MVTTGTHLTSTAPIGYTPPEFPGLYWPVNPKRGQPQYLYFSSDIWRFTLYWTLLLYGLFYVGAGLCALALRPSKLAAGVALLYAIVGGVEALMSGTVVGYILSAVYNAGYFRMTTWMPLVWGAINVLVLVVSAFSLQGGL